MTWSILFGLSSGLCWGVADFLGGLQSRRLPALLVTLWSQVIAGGTLLAVLLLFYGAPNSAGLGWGIVAGLCGGLALLLFYRALSVGVMSLVAPVAACGAVVPVAAGALRGEQYGPLIWIGIVFTVIGVVLVSIQLESSKRPSGKARLALPLALGAALGFGLFMALIDRATDVPGASPLWVGIWTRLGSVPLLATLALLGRQPLAVPVRRLGALGLVGILDMSANILFSFASQGGYLAIVGVLGSLYPVMTILLGRLVLAERLSRVQYGGAALALLGVALLAGS